ncbi:protein kinase C iota type isoform X2 [Brevipalpus obovatus]|uniref:protein kinase C iota type isoform X2 n=1 Tax=Brevipalpus obovatus TaxID=246614 RepID=UPI003D9FA87D
MSLKIKAVFDNDIVVTYVDSGINLDNLSQEMRDLFSFDNSQKFTMKFIDEEGDPCMLSCDSELEEAINIIYGSSNTKDAEMVIHVFPGVPSAAGQPCPGEDKSIYRRGARRWRKVYRVNGHTFQPKRFNRRAFCIYCSDRIWGLGRQGFKCISCKLMVHKKCHKLIQAPCFVQLMNTGSSSSTCSLNHSLNNDGVKGFGHGRSGTPAKKRPAPTHPSQNSGNKSNHSWKSSNDEPSLPPQDQGFDMPVSEGARRQYKLEDFDLIKVIGRGSYAKVLLVELKETKRPYAMKVIKKELVADDEDIDWVQTEKHVFEIATGCEFLVGLHSCFQTESKLFFVIEFVSGGDLMFHMQRKRRLVEDHARFYAAEISLALSYLHGKGIIYRDLKLDNVLLDKHGHIKLTDYGMCKEGIRPGDTTITFCGTPNYIAPEIIRGFEYSFSVDWWALGVLLFEMLAGRSPFDIRSGPENPELSTEDFLFQVISTKAIRIPRFITVKAQNVLKGFLDKSPDSRLGCNPALGGFQEIKSHPFFKPIDWDLLSEKKVPPPYVPKINKDPLEHFDPGFTQEPVELTPPIKEIIDKIDQSEFEGFEFVNPEIMTVEDAV